MRRNILSQLLLTLYCSCLTGVVNAGEPEWKLAKGPLETRWTQTVNPENAWPEYPRPQMVRRTWKNLNGLWEYAITKKAQSQPKNFEGDILVPYPVESALSGVRRRLGYTERLWYRRSFEVPTDWQENGRVLLHFGAVDYDATIILNGKQVGRHLGGYDPFTIDITDDLKKGDGPQELVVSVWDPSDMHHQVRGKQKLATEGVWYTASSGIWQTVWLEPVPERHIDSLRIVPDVDRSLVRVTAKCGGGKVNVVVRDGNRVVATATGMANEPMDIKLSDMTLWSPKNPHLYDLTVAVIEDGREGDRVESYFGMRKIALGKDKAGITRIMLNNEPIFQYGLLDQGFWPDGLYTAPTDAALRYDIEVTKKLGFNLIRKHVKVEPARWYTWCDRMGMIVWQDMPNGDRFLNVFKPVPDPDLIRTPESAAQFEMELKRMVETLGNHPSIVMWIPFNEGWGQYDTGRITNLVKKLDPSRLVDSASGLVDRGTGEVNDLHNYLGQTVPPPEEKRAITLGEFGGLGRRVKGHMWKEEGGWDYRKIDDRDALTDAYVELTKNLWVMNARGLSGAVYTQTTDVEIEVNGHLTYDRKLFKLDPKRVSEANLALYETPPVIQSLLPTSEEAPQAWRYTKSAPAGEWMNPRYADSTWKQGQGCFGDEKKFGPLVRTSWTKGDLWTRKEFDLPKQLPDGIQLLLHHEGNADIYLNGHAVTTNHAATPGYRLIELNAEALKTLRPGEKNTLAVRVRPSEKEQYLDIGIVTVQPRR